MRIDYSKSVINQEIKSCIARDCPRTPTIQTDGHWICRYHFGKPARDWPTITNWLKDNARQIDVEEVKLGYVRADNHG